ncbi:FkbM family methyltransferase [Nitrospira sp. NS4]|uniref:FkbM family methyltransferase n=1 Tax=Nitrospira sp. NS4 TaxID=3414498 RepID=UPI003C2ED146
MKSKFHLYVKKFGLLKGAELYIKGKYSRQEHCLTVPGLRHPVSLRGKTSDHQAFRKVFVEGEYAFDLGFTPRIILDGGANVGYSALFFAHQFPEALIIAIEPEPENFRLLVQNTVGYKNIRPVQKALWPRVTHLAIENTTGQPDAFRVRESPSADDSTIPTTTINDLLQETSMDQLDLLKLDIEGSEKELLEDPARNRWISRTRALIVELHDRFKPGCTTAVEQALTGQNFSRSQRGENILFIRDSSF